MTASPPLTDIEEGGEKGMEKGEKGKEVRRERRGARNEEGSYQ